MTLNHDKVRALLDYHREELCAQHDAKRPEDCSLCGLHAIGVALAEEWLAARTVRWGAGESGGLSGPGWYGYVEPDSDDEGAWVARATGGAFRWCESLAEARAWLEAKAREAGYEVEGSA